MLTVQMENQDPLNPVDSADYALQLATFSSVEQQVLTNDLLTNLTSSMSGGGLGSIGQWVGMDVRSGSFGHFNGTTIEMTAPENADADQRILVIQDEFGNFVTRTNVANTGTTISWDGTLADGSIAAPGTYQFNLETLKNGELLETQTVQPYNRVREATIADGAISLVLEGGIIVSPEDVSALRSAN